MEIYGFCVMLYFILIPLLFFAGSGEEKQLPKQKKKHKGTQKENKASYTSFWILLAVTTAVKCWLLFAHGATLAASMRDGVTANLLAGLFGVPADNAVLLHLLKLPALLADGVLGYLVYRHGVEIGWQKKQVQILAAAVLLLPVLVLGGSVFGYGTGVAALCIVGAVFLLKKENYLIPAALLVFAAYLDSVGLICLALYLFLLCRTKKANVILPGAGVAAGAYFLLGLLFKTETYGNALAGFFKVPYVFSKSGANLFAGLMQNGQAGTLFPLIVTVLAGAAALAFAAWILVRSDKEDKLWYAFGAVSGGFALFAMGQHAVSLAIGAVLLLFLFAETRDNRAGIGFFALALVASVAAGVFYTYWGKGTDVPQANTLLCVVSWVGLAVYGWLTYFGYRRYITDDAPVEKKNAYKAPAGALSGEKGLFRRSKESSRLVRADYLIMAVMTLAYGLLGFTHLGAKDTPRTEFWPEAENASFVVELEEPSDLDRMYMFTCWIDRRDAADRDVVRNAELEASFDGGVTYEKIMDFQIKDVLRWRYEPLRTQTADANGVTASDMLRGVTHVKITVPDEPRYVLNEMAFWGPDGETPVAVKGVTDLGGCGETLSNLFDEQDKADYETGWYNGSYFDEIYHPRTAYEHLHGLQVYENTHPPLGKLTIALGMIIFGVTPFGWRFFGVFFAMLMIPFIYAFAKKMFGSTKWAFITAFLLLFDFMTTAQPRLATIDTYITFYIIGMYYFMYRYYTMSFYDTKLWKTLVPLGLSGLFFGLGIAAKWTGFYAGLGLAILFFITLGRRIWEYHVAVSDKRNTENNGIAYAHVRQVFGRNTAITLLFCVVAFVIVPFIIYWVSFLPYNIPGSGYNFDAFVRTQQHMLNYHSGLKGTHGFSSEWYQWPIVFRPILYYVQPAEFRQPGMTQSIVSMGNPLIWWLTFPAMVITLILAIRRKWSKELTVIVTAFMALYLPWALVPRMSFIYHFFTNTPILMLWIVCLMKYFNEKKRLSMPVIYTYMALVLVCYIMFYPILTGMSVPTGYINSFLHWFGSWSLG